MVALASLGLRIDRKFASSNLALKMPKRIHIATYGCQMNDYESDRTFRLFRDQQGYEWTDDLEQADLVLFNTCSIREKADQKAMSQIGFLRTVKNDRPKMIVAVGGCMAQSRGPEIQRRFSHVDIVFGTHQWSRLPDMVQKVQTQKKQLLDTDLFGWRNYKFLPYRESKADHPVSELVTVQNGCDKFCTFCLVPFTRGRQVSRSHKEIVDEVKSLVDQGVREVMLLGQNVNAYGQDQRAEIGFAELLHQVGKIEGLRRLRFITSHPSELTLEMIDEIAENKAVCEHLHLPIQSGSDSVLEAMNRGYTIDMFRDLANELRKRIPSLALTTDIIVGFPGETQADFQKTLDVVKEFEFEDSFSFSYSPRPHTKAATWESEFVSEDLSQERLNQLQTLQAQIRKAKRDALVGKTVEVLVEGMAKRKKGQLTGKTRQNQCVNFEGSVDWIGKMKDVQITESLTHSLRGRVLDS